VAFTFVMRIQKLKENREFRRAYNRGKVFVTPYAVVYITKNRTGDVRLGITAGKKIGKAVKRNRAKRVITAAFDECAPHIPTGHDFVVVARTRILNTKSNTVAANMARQLKKQDLWVE
jgi:ribonuclease P protein component